MSRLSRPSYREPVESCKELREAIQDVMKMNNEALVSIINTYDISSTPQFPSVYLSTLSGKELNLALRVIVVAFYVTGAREIPREHQVKAVCLSYNNDSAIIAGTGSGKTLITALLMWMTGRGRVSITISPLKRLQDTQGKDFEEKYQIPTLVVNESTERTAEFWRKHVFDPSERSPGRIQHLLVTPEQLFKLKEGYFSRVGNLIRNPSYKKFIGRFFVDEAHFIHYAGLPHHGLTAFRQAYGRLDEIKVLFPTIPWHALTATAPAHVYESIHSKVLNSGCHIIRYSSNRPNTVYAMHRADGGINHLENYNMFLTEPFDYAAQPRILLFFDNKTLCSQVRQYLMERLPKSGLPFPREEVVRFYRAGMSAQFLSQAHEAFAAPGGHCKIYCTTKCNSTVEFIQTCSRDIPGADLVLKQGIDYPDVDIVVNVDIPPDVPEALQRGGRVVRSSGKIGLFLILYEEWVLDIDLSEFFEEHKGLESSDPDRPRRPLTDKSTRYDRAPYSMVNLIQDDPLCLRKFFAEYLGDISPTALSFAHTCCHRHEGFDLQKWVPGPVGFDSQEERAQNAVVAQTRSRNHYRSPITDRDVLDKRLRLWRNAAAMNDEALRPEYYILSNKAIVEVARALPSKLRSTQDLQALLEESDSWKDEWAQSILDIVAQFDREKAS
ncbi:hypothetical protein PQX77_013151 [Marasmius sp. AFHP31]|nr:hypothetical protein PQX77_013151 [Marasmius sp. AFHP31]